MNFHNWTIYMILVAIIAAALFTKWALGQLKPPATGGIVVPSRPEIPNHSLRVVTNGTVFRCQQWISPYDGPAIIHFFGATGWRDLYERGRSLEFKTEKAARDYLLKRFGTVAEGRIAPREWRPV